MPSRAYVGAVHPIEHLRYVARSGGADVASLVQETAVALASLRGDHANLVLACRRIVERHPTAGPLWWLCSLVLTAERPSDAAWEVAELLEEDAAPRVLAGSLADAARVLTIGWPDVAGAGLIRRGDVTVWCADSRHEASSFMQRLERFGVESEPVPAEQLAHAATSADLVVLDAVAACPQRLLAPVGSRVLAAVAASVGTPVWTVVGVGRRLPVEYVEAIADRVLTGAAPWDAELDEIPLASVTRVVTADGSAVPGAEALRADCPFTPELLRASPI